MNDASIGWLKFTDGVTRNVSFDATRQYVFSDDDCNVRGVWLLTDQNEEVDVPMTVLSY